METRVLPHDWPLSCLCRGRKVRNGGWFGRRWGRRDLLWSSRGTSPERVPEVERHFDERAFEPVPHGEAVDGLVEFGRVTIGIGLGGDRVSIQGWMSLLLVPLRSIAP